MERKLRKTEDGSHTLYVKGLDETYHSTHGAIQESMHVFIRNGLYELPGKKARILDIGFGTGLNALLTLEESLHLGLVIDYHAVEKYPLGKEEYEELNYHEFLCRTKHEDLLELHSSEPGMQVNIRPGFTLYKELSDFRSMQPPGVFDLVYFDAFAPDKQPELWTPQIFSAIHKKCHEGALLLTYSSKGAIRRAMQSAGFDVEKIPGPPGKIEMVRARRV